MNGLFAFLFLLAVVGLAVGLAHPHSFEKFLKHNSNRKHISFGFGFLIVIFLVLVAVTAPKTTTLQTANTGAVIDQSAKTTSASTTAKPVITTSTVITTQPVPFTTSTVQAASLAKGITQVKVQGVNGVETQTFKVTYTNAQETSRTLTSTVLTTPPVNEIVENGTYVAPALAPKPTPAPPAPAPAPPPASCYPLTNGGKCYEPGEYCRNSDHGAGGVAGNGESIICTDNNGWRWEPK